eukprot:TRINITY_DN14834_c0_g1_i1.p1 TRINITY_DN14834_c0_g1~~TRINITY_DN14834_c0_g1_i1.p1  ORF type:complete len:590 (-),score=82.17 TRINITY_DN14834_c0_g1_i1:238-1974(-)
MSKRKHDADVSKSSGKKVAQDDRDEPNSFARLPDEMFSEILSYLTYKEQGRMRETSSEMYNRVSANSRHFRTTRTVDIEELCGSRFVQDSNVGVSCRLGLNDIIRKSDHLHKIEDRIHKLELIKKDDDVDSDLKAVTSTLMKLERVQILVVHDFTEACFDQVTLQLLQNLLPTLKHLEIRYGVVPHNLPSFQFKNLTNLNLFMWKGDNVSQLLQNCGQTLKHLELTIDPKFDLNFSEHFSDLICLKSLNFTVVGGFSDPNKYISQFLSSLSPTVTSLTLDGFNLEPPRPQLNFGPEKMNLRNLVISRCRNCYDGFVELLSKSSETLESLTLRNVEVDFATIKTTFPELHSLDLCCCVSNLRQFLKYLPNLQSFVLPSSLSPSLWLEIQNLPLTSVQFHCHSTYFMVPPSNVGRNLRKVELLNLADPRNKDGIYQILGDCQPTLEYLKISFMTRDSSHFRNFENILSGLVTEMRFKFPRLRRIILCFQEINHINHGFTLMQPQDTILLMMQNLFLQDEGFQIDSSGWVGYKRGDHSDYRECILARRRREEAKSDRRQLRPRKVAHRNYLAVLQKSYNTH